MQRPGKRSKLWTLSKTGEDRKRQGLKSIRKMGGDEKKYWLQPEAKTYF